MVHSISAFIIAVIILTSNWNEFFLCFKPECCSLFLEIYRLPIQIVASGIALSGFRILVIRGKQMNKQYEILKKPLKKIRFQII